MKTHVLLSIGVALCNFSLSTQLVFAQGGLTPPGAPAPTMKTLDQIEPRTPITKLPYTISQPGSYYLTTNLTANPGGIGIWASGVTLDLMGFELDGTGGSMSGIAVAPGLANICIRNGTVRRWNLDGVNISSAKNCLLQDLRVSGNFRDGLVLGDASVVSRCVASSNTGNGIVGGESCSIIGCVVFSNNANGIRIDFAGVARDCSAMRNGATGLAAGRGSSITDCSAAYNIFTGISAGSGSTVTGCSAYFNKGHGIAEVGGGGAPGLSVANCTATFNDQDGFSLINGSAVKHCLSKGNQGNGIRTSGFGSTITDCSANDNVGSGIILNSWGTLTGCTASGNDIHGIHVTGYANRIEGNSMRSNGSDGISVDATGIKNVVVRNMSSANANFQYRVPGIPGQPPAGANIVGPIVVDVTSATANAWANFNP